MTRALLVALAFTSGCLDLVEPDVGPLGQAACIDADSDPGVAVSYQRDVVGAIFSSEAYQCVRCHTAAGETPLGLVVGGLDLGSYDGLRRGGVQAGADVVVPGRPCASALYLKVSAGPPFGARMPLDGPPFLSAADVGLIHDWIAEGAHAD